MHWAKAIVTVLLLWSNTAWGATLRWDPSSGSNIVGYRVYECSQSQCSPSSSTAALLATLGNTTSFNIGTPAVTTYFVVTAYSAGGLESNSSNVATYYPASTSSTPPTTSNPPESTSSTTSTSTSPPSVTLKVLGSPTSGQPWTVQAYPANVTGTVTVEYWVNNDLDRTEYYAPYCPFEANENGDNCVTAMRPFGSYTIEARVKSNGTEVAREAVTVLASASPPTTSNPPESTSSTTSTSTSAPSVTLKVLGSPTSGQPWTVQAYPANVTGTVTVEYWVNNAVDRTENFAPYCPFEANENGDNCVTAMRPFGSYTIEARVKSNGTEVAREAVTVLASASPPATSAPSVMLKVLGSPTSGQPWAVQADPANVAGSFSVLFWINNNVNRIENFAPYCPFSGEDGSQCRTAVRPFMFYTIEARVVSNGTELARRVIVVKASSHEIGL